MRATKAKIHVMTSRRDFFKYAGIAGGAVAASSVSRVAMAALPEPVIQTSPNTMAPLVQQYAEAATVHTDSAGAEPDAQDIANLLAHGQPLYMLLYVSMIVFFAFFYNAAGVPGRGLYLKA